MTRHCFINYSRHQERGLNLVGLLATKLLKSRYGVVAEVVHHKAIQVVVEAAAHIIVADFWRHNFYLQKQ